MPSPSAALRRLVVGLAAALVMSLLVTSPAAAQAGVFRDAADDAYYSVPVAVLAQEGVFDDTECGYRGFCPSDSLDRQTMAVWIVRVLDGTDPAAVSATRFADVEPDSFYAPFIERMAELGVTEGCGNGTGFCPEEPVTRAQMAVFLTRAFSLAPGHDPGFLDVAADAWYFDQVAALAASGITRGCVDDPPKFCPSRDTSRAHMATFLYRALRNEGGGEATPRHDLFPGAPPEQPPRQTPAEFNPAADGGGVIAAGDLYSCGLRYNQTVTCWGRHFHGVKNVPPFRFLGVSAGEHHVCGVRAGGAVACWGSHKQGERDAPAGRFIAVSAGGTHSCAIATDNTIACWGSNEHGQLDAPTGPFTAISAGGTHSCAIATDNTIACWGSNEHGQLDAPAGRFTAISAGHSHSCAIATDNTIACWGSNGYRQSDAPAGRFTTVSAGYTHSCAVATDGTITCWGRDSLGLLESPPGQFTAVSVGSAHSCAVTIDGTVACWGDWAGWSSPTADPSDPSQATWASMPVEADCENPLRLEAAEPGSPTGTQIVHTGAIDLFGFMSQPFMIRWAAPCLGGSVDHYLVQWRRGNEDFGDHRQRTVEATGSSTAYSLTINDRYLYAVRVIAVNDSGRTSSAALEVVTPVNELRDITERIVITYQDRHPWLADVWDNLNHGADGIVAADLGPALAGTAGYRGMIIAHPRFGLPGVRGIIVHEMAHTYDAMATSFNEKGQGPAVGAAMLYLRVMYGDECRPNEMFADMPIGLILLESGLEIDLYRPYWQSCDRLSSTTVQWSQADEDVARSVFMHQEVPRWLYDTYQNEDGTWDLDAIRADTTDQVRPDGFITPIGRWIRERLRHLIPDL